MRTAVIGLGPMGRRHVTASGRVPGISLVAAADLRAEVLGAVGLGSDVSRYCDPQEMLSTERPDLVVIATTAPSHRQLVEASVGAGAKAILCEKPMACSLADARAMLDCCRDQGVALAVNHSRRHVPAYRWLAERIASGAWGKLRSVRVSVPGIGLGCLGTHFVDFMSFLGGRPLDSVVGWVDEPRGVNPRGPEFVDPGGVVVGETSDGAMFFLHQIEDGAGPHHIAIDLTGARVMVDEMERTVDIVVRDTSVQPGPGRPPQFSREELPPDHPLDLEIVDHIAAVLGELSSGADLTCDGVHGYRSLEVILATYTSHDNGHVPVALPIEDPAILCRALQIT